MICEGKPVAAKADGIPVPGIAGGSGPFYLDMHDLFFFGQNTPDLAPDES
jgi:hypothetical protein